jgi:hypothetical protein
MAVEAKTIAAAIPGGVESKDIALTTSLQQHKWNNRKLNAGERTELAIRRVEVKATVVQRPD